MSGEWIDKGDYRKKILATEKDLGEDKIIEIVEVDPGNHVKPHKHYNIREIFIVEQAGGVIIRDDEPLTTYKDQVVICEPRTVHEVVNDSDSTLRLVVFKTGYSEDDTEWLE